MSTQALTLWLNKKWNVDPTSFLVPRASTQFTFNWWWDTELNYKLCNNPKQNKIQGSETKIISWRTLAMLQVAGNKIYCRQIVIHLFMINISQWWPKLNFDLAQYLLVYFIFLWFKIQCLSLVLSQLFWYANDFNGLTFSSYGELPNNTKRHKIQNTNFNKENGRINIMNNKQNSVFKSIVLETFIILQLVYWKECAT